MEFLARPLVVFLKYLKEWCGSYGIAIILLTIIVRVVFWPVTQKANNSMRKMQKVGPMVKELKEKYKDNPQLMNQKMMELYRQEKVNPLGGCLPMLLQFPVFIALYSTLEAAVELRNVPFLWAKDLSQPDAIGPEIWGFSLHPLILISTGLMVLQMKLTPQAGDPLQRKLMMFMPLIMLIFFYNFPSGLALYWTVNNILSILQMKYSQYAAKKEEEREASSAAKAA
jgi:YidC/Oxa1 family membrane protein insertase